MYKIKISFIIAPIILILFTSFTNAESGNTLFSNGIKEFQQGNFQKAVDWFTMYIDQDALNAKIYKNRAVAYMGLQYYDSAINDLKKAIELDPELEGLHSNIGAAWHYKKEYRKAISHYDIEISKRPKIYSTYFNRAISKTQLNDYQGALNDLSVVLELKPDNYWALAYRGDIYGKLKKMKTAKSAYEKAIKLDPNNNYAKNKLAKLDQSDDKNVVSDQDKNTVSDKKEAKKTNSNSVKSDKSNIAKNDNSNTVKNDSTNTVKSDSSNTVKSDSSNTVKNDNSNTVKNDKVTVQSGAYLEEPNAIEMYDILSKKGYKSRILKLKDKKDRFWFLVRIGKYKTDQEAELLEIVKKLKDKENIDAIIRPVGKF